MHQIRQTARSPKPSVLTIETATETQLAQTLTFLQTLQQTTIPEPKKYREAGSLKGLFTMADDFDAPLEDLRDYM